MENATHFIDPLSVLNTTSAIGQNSTLPYPFPASTVVTVIVCCFGISANVLVISTIVLSSLRTSVFMNLIMSLAIFDSTYLMIIINVQRGLFGQWFISPSLLYCRLNIFLLFSSGMLSSWVTVLISLERYIAICHPFEVHIYCTKKHTYLALMALVLITSTGCIPFFYTCSTTRLDQMPRCNSSGPNAEYDIILKSTVLTFYSFIPFLLITILNILMMKKIQLQKAFQSQSQQSNEPSSAYNSSLIIMMVCVCSIFAVTSFPSAILVIVSVSYKFNSVQLSIFDYDGWLFRLTYTLEEINHGINFFLYCLTGSVFRFAFFILFKCREKESPEQSFQQEMAIAENVL